MGFDVFARVYTLMLSGSAIYIMLSLYDGWWIRALAILMSLPLLPISVDLGHRLIPDKGRLQ